MISRLRHRSPETAQAIHGVLQAAYAVEAAILGVREFAPLARRVEDVAASASVFFGFREHDELLGVIETELPAADGCVCIASLAVVPGALRRGIGRSLVEHATAEVDHAFRVSTAAGNGPAIRLYERIGFTIRRRFMTPEGIAMIELGLAGRASAGSTRS